jgi:hypothetical protein
LSKCGAVLAEQRYRRCNPDRLSFPHVISPRDRNGIRVRGHRQGRRSGALSTETRRDTTCGMKRRPKKPPTVTAQIGLRLHPELRAALEQAAARERRPLSNLMRIALSDWLVSRQQGMASGQRAV